LWRCGAIRHVHRPSEFECRDYPECGEPKKSRETIYEADQRWLDARNGTRSHVRSNKAEERPVFLLRDIGVADIVNVASSVINRVYKLQPSSEEQRSQCLRVDANNNVPAEEEPLDNLTYARRIPAMDLWRGKRAGSRSMSWARLDPSASGRTYETGDGNGCRIKLITRSEIFCESIPNVTGRSGRSALPSSIKASEPKLKFGDRASQPRAADCAASSSASLFQMGAFAGKSFHIESPKASVAVKG
jgi:hypothetical protein